METRVPKYYSLKRDLVKKIEMGEYQEDTPILSERELMETYQVSRITVRRAIDELVNEGYLYKIQGKRNLYQGGYFQSGSFFYLQLHGRRAEAWKAAGKAGASGREPAGGREAGKSSSDHRGRYGLLPGQGYAGRRGAAQLYPYVSAGETFSGDRTF